ncbi:ATPase SWSAP1 [Scleropages formosus]|uniref:ATPase SWSAP1 n=1 Tax=Scleropages formosus TaxID=113540 RepID=UPI0010FA66AD|nr:ATPase SWSAP1 [Scleropages formosus]
MAHVLALALQQRSRQSQCVRPSPVPRAASSCVVTGARCSPKTPLMFLAAITATSELGLKVLFLSPSPVPSLPGPVQEALAKLSPEALKKMQFRYPGSLEELLHEVASLHESPSRGASPPSLVILDRMEHYLRPGRDGVLQQDRAAAAHISALLLDTAAFLTQKLEERGEAALSCQVIVAFDPEWEGRTSGDLTTADPILTIVDRYFPLRCTLSQDERCAPLQAAAKTEEVWQICFSRLGVTTPCSTNTEDSGLGQLWRLVVCQDGAMNFSVVSS